MSGIKIRPRFKRIESKSPSEILEQIRTALDKEDNSIRGLIVDHHVTLKIPPEDQHFWSPQLGLEVEESPEGSLIRGLYGPKPSVWLMFIFFYALLGFIAVVISIIGFSEINLGLPGRILWLLPVTIAIFVMLYLSARAGQKLGHDQMVELNAFLNESLKPQVQTGK